MTLIGIQRLCTFLLDSPSSQALVRHQFIGLPAAIAGITQLLLLAIIYAVFRRAFRNCLIAPWLRLIAIAYASAAAAIRILAMVLPASSAPRQGAGLLAAFLGLVGTALAFQQINLSLPPIRRHARPAQVFLRLVVLILVAQNLVELIGIWIELIDPVAATTRLVIPASVQIVLYVVASAMLFAAIWCLSSFFAHVRDPGTRRSSQ